MSHFDRVLIIMALLSIFAAIIVLGVRVDKLEDQRIVEPISEESVSLLWRDVQHTSVSFTHVSEPY